MYRIFSNDSYKTILLFEYPIKDIEGDDLDTSYDAYLFQSKYKTLRVNIVRIKDFLDSIGGEGANTINVLHRRPVPQFSLSEAIIAIESSKHLLYSLKSCKEYIEKVIPASQNSYTQLFFNTHESLLSEIEDFLVIPYISKLLKIDWLWNSVNSTKWEEKKEEYSSFINRLIHLIQDFKEKIASIGGGSIPKSIQAKTVLKAGRYCQEQLIEAFGKIKRCSMPGREQMKRDYKIFNTALIDITNTKPPVEFEEYIEVWNYNVEKIYNWITTHLSLSLKLQKNLFYTAPLIASLNKSARNNMISSIETLYRQQLQG